MVLAAFALGIGAASFASGARGWDLGTGNGSGDGIWERGTGAGMGFGSGESEQRYSGKPDGFAGTHTLIHNS